MNKNIDSQLFSSPSDRFTFFSKPFFSAPQPHKTWLEQTHKVNEEVNIEIIDKENISKSGNYF